MFEARRPEEDPAAEKARAIARKEKEEAEWAALPWWRKLRWHGQNLNEESAHPLAWLRSSRCWWNYSPGHDRHYCLGLEWWFRFDWAAGISFERRENRILGVHLSLLGSSVHLSWESPTVYQDEDRDWGLRIHNESLWWEWGVPFAFGGDGLPWWRSFSISILPLDYVWGPLQYTALQEDGPHDVLIPMPERSYRAEVTLSEEARKRPKQPWWWPVFSKKHVGSVAMYSDPIPNRVEHGGDALRAMGVEARTLNEAIAETLRQILDDRVQSFGRVELTEDEIARCLGRRDDRPKAGSS